VRAASTVHRIVMAAAIGGGALTLGTTGVRAQTDEPRAANPKSTEHGDSFLDRAVQQAEEARAAGRLDDAAEAYERALTERPSWIEGRRRLGLILHALERWEEAREAFGRVVEEKPDDAVAWVFRGLCEIELGGYDRASRDLRRAREIGAASRELDSLARYHLATLLTRAGSFDEAVDSLTSLAREGYESPDMIVAMGLALLRFPRLPSEVPPGDREMVVMGGRALHQWARSRRSAARLSFEELILRFPEKSNLHYAFGVFQLLTDPDAALEEFRQELRVTPDHVPAMLQIALESLLRDDPETALPLARRAVELEPQLPTARNALGRALLKLGEIDEAIGELEKGAELAPGDRATRFALVRAYQLAGREEDAAREREAFEALDAAVNASPPSTLGTLDPGT
jgi:protein O-GlcNAc transferase